MHTLRNEDEEQATVECPACASQQDEPIARLGVLGRWIHYRCRHCGWQWAERSE